MGKGNTLEITGRLSAKHIKVGDGKVIIDLGLISTKCITTAGCEYLVDSFQDSTGSPMDAFHWHGSGTSTGAESSTDTGLGTEIGTRVSGTQVETSSVIYKTVATQTYTTGADVTEHGLFSSSGGPTLWDRSLFVAIPMGSGDGIEWTYELTCTAGG